MFLDDGLRRPVDELAARGYRVVGPTLLRRHRRRMPDPAMAPSRYGDQ